MDSIVTGHITKFNAKGLKPWSTYLVTACGFNRKKTGSRIVYGKTGNLTVDTHLASMYNMFLSPETSPAVDEFCPVGTNRLS